MKAKRLGDYLICSPAVLKNAVKKQGQRLKRRLAPKHIGEILLEDGLISQDELEAAVRKQRVDRLRASPVFSMLSEAELAAISTRFVEVAVEAGEQFIIQDESDPTLYILAKGKVEVYRTGLDGTLIHLAYVEPFEPIGEMGYFQGGIRTASVRAVEHSELLRANYSALTHYFEYVPRVAHEFMRIVEQRRMATEEIMQEAS
ncbi:MAG: cyclic nucleotide-binding domain-containing protein [Gammaproteobacteria bacterium]